MTAPFPIPRLRALTSATALFLAAPALIAAPAASPTRAASAPPAPAPAAPPAAPPAPAAPPTPTAPASPEPDPKSDPKSQPAPAPIPLWLDLAHSGLDKAAVRDAIEQELGAPVTLTDTADTKLRVTIESEQRVRVAFTTQSGEELSRTVDLPADPARRVEVIALMVGNLTRNEAADLLATLEAARKAPPPPAAKPAPEPKPEAKPKSTPPPTASTLIKTPSPAINLSLFHPLAIFPNSDQRILKVELGLAYSRVGAIEGAALSLGGLRVEQHVRGFAFGGFFSIAGGKVDGFQSSYIYTESRGPVHGLAVGGLVLRHPAPLTGLGVSGVVELGGDVEGIGLAGVVNVAHRVQGAAVGGVVSIATEPVNGLLLAGIFASSKKLDGIGIAGLAELGGDAQGLQIAGLANIAGDVRGFSVSGLTNITGNVNGFALSGLANVTGDVHGATLSVVNVGQRVHGAQIGVVNVASEVDGAQIGLVNIAKNGRIQAEAFATNTMPINAGVRFVSGYSYSELTFGYDPVDKDNQYSGGLGAHFDLSKLTVEAGIHGSSTQHPDTSEKPTRADLHYRGRVGYRVTSFLEPFVGGGARHGVYGTGDGKVDPEVLVGVALF